MAHNAVNRAKWRSVMALQSFVNDVTHFNINGQNILAATNARNQFMNIERYFRENLTLGERLRESLFGDGGFFSNHGYQDPGAEYQRHVTELLELIQTVLYNNGICQQQLQARINDVITVAQFEDGGEGGLQQGQSYEISKEACFQAIESIREKNLEFLNFIGEDVGAAAQAHRSIEEVLYFNSADISPFTAILDRLLNEQQQIVNAEHAQVLRNTLNDWMMFFELPVQQRLDLFGNILSQNITSEQVMTALQDRIRGYAMNSRTILNHNGFNGAQVIPLIIDGINPYQEAWGLMQQAATAGIMRGDDPGVGEDNDPNQALRPKTALYCSLISFLTSGPSITVRLKLLKKHFVDLASSTQNGVGFVRIGDLDNPVQAPPAAVAKFRSFKRHMVRINALPQSQLQKTPANHFRKNLSECFETMFPSIIEGDAGASLAQRITALEQIEDPDWNPADFGSDNAGSSDDSSDGSGMDQDYGGGRLKRTRRKRRKKRKKRKKTRRKRKKTRKKTRIKRKKTKRKRTRRKR
tara:strand:- start:60 stop:1634 length:1575 start_codon:yes stop_codon:yes gene_type:complete